ncbi:hypothetical protein [Pasteuria penetrans]|nr:hypothetical protein [Pasteuria penetrans]
MNRSGTHRKEPLMSRSDCEPGTSEEVMEDATYDPGGMLWWDTTDGRNPI